MYHLIHIHCRGLIHALFFHLLSSNLPMPRVYYAMGIRQSGPSVPAMADIRFLELPPRRRLQRSFCRILSGGADLCTPY
jgi:hypothetical protein